MIKLKLVFLDSDGNLCMYEYVNMRNIISVIRECKGLRYNIYVQLNIRIF